MKQLILYLYHHASAYKTKKSIFNIIIGKKSHQTFFDAVSLNILSLYGCAPKLKYEQLEQMISHESYHHTTIQTSNRMTYSTLDATFKAFQLLVQTVSHIQHNQRTFLPITSQVDIHEVVRLIYYEIEQQQLQDAFEEEVTTLFKMLSEKHDTLYTHYLLTGYDEPMYTFAQISMIESIDIHDLNTAYYEELLSIYLFIQNADTFPILSQCIMPIELSDRVMQTLQLLQKGYSIAKVAQIEQVRETTIKDHILDLFMKQLLTNYDDFFTHPYNEFLKFYQAHPYQRLKLYKEQFDTLSYFELKLAIIGSAKGELHA
ncbi:helix-turn-helix domain-containing protein [Staphylococcus pseudintermedius]|nr:helix-turn-helix domain-containing protein [Staphylococcus pseudintermedius]